MYVHLGSWCYKRTYYYMYVYSQSIVEWLRYTYIYTLSHLVRLHVQICTTIVRLVILTYFRAESIKTAEGLWGWRAPSYNMHVSYTY